MSPATALRRIAATAPVDDLFAVLEADGAVLVEDLLTAEVVQRVNREVDGAVAAADPDDPTFNPVLKAFMGATTKNVAGVPGLSPTFATEVLCHPVLLALADRLLGPSCARFQLNVGQVLERGPGAEDQWLHRDEAVWSDIPRPAPQLELATVIALVDFTADNGATRVVPGSHRWPDRDLPPDQLCQPAPDEVVCAEMPAGSAVVYTGGTIHGGGANTTDRPRRGVHLSYCLGWLRTEENNVLAIPPAVAATLPRQAQELIGYAVHDRIDRGGGYLGMVGMQDPAALLAAGALGGRLA